MCCCDNKRVRRSTHHQIHTIITEPSACMALPLLYKSRDLTEFLMVQTVSTTSKYDLVLYVSSFMALPQILVSALLKF